jgi:hypothetical protein
LAKLAAGLPLVDMGLLRVVADCSVVQAALEAEAAA